MKDIYYKVDDIKYPTKKAALDCNHIDDIEFYCADEALANFDWGMCDGMMPSEVVSTMFGAIKERAQQLRDKYDYLQLFFSNGTDSYTIFKVCVDNNIPIDELIIHRFSAIDNFDFSVHNLEQSIGCRFSIKNNEDTLRRWGTKITYVDHGIEFYKKLLLNEQAMADNLFFGMSSYAYMMISYDIPDIIDHNNMCQILGMDKPRLIYHYDKIETFNFDTLVLHCSTPNMDIINVREPFYFTDDHPTLMGLQYLALRKLYGSPASEPPKKQPLFIADPMDQFGYNIVNQHLRHQAEINISGMFNFGKVCHNVGLPTDGLNIKDYAVYWELMKFHPKLLQDSMDMLGVQTLHEYNRWTPHKDIVINLYSKKYTLS